MELTRCFEILEISSDATYEETKASYRLLVQVWHPDKHSHNDKVHAKATSKLKDMNAAWSHLEAYFKKSGNRESDTRETASKEAERKTNDQKNRDKQERQAILDREKQRIYELGKKFDDMWTKKWKGCI
jgi:curved DNA-binding protein CbpA